MKWTSWRRGRVAVRTAVFLAGCGLVGVLLKATGFGLAELLAITVAAGILSALTMKLPWDGFLFPCDAVLLALCLITGRYEIVIAGIGAAIASSSVVLRWKRTTYVSSIRNVAAMSAATFMSRSLVPSWFIMAEGSTRTINLGFDAFGDWIFSARSVPSLIISSLAFFLGASSVETILRRRKERAFGDFWFMNFGRNLHHLFFTLLLGAIISIAYRDIGIIAFALFVLPALLTRNVLKKNLDLRSSRIEALRALSSSVDARDQHTYDHSNRVCRLACMLAREMGFGQSTIETIESGALLHDIGKLGVDTEILSKSEPLDDDERRAIREHPLRSAEVVSRVGLLKQAVGIVRHHHERPDGNGYPDGLKGYQIPVGARILNVADAFDAMTSERPYRARKTVREAMGELRRGSGSEFDPVVVEYLSMLLGSRPNSVIGSDLR